MSLMSMEAEQAVLGAVMLAPQVWDEVCFLRPDDFAVEEHQRLFGLMVKSESARDFVGLSAVAKTPQTLSYLADLMRNCPGASGAKNYATIVKDRATLRRIASACANIMASLSPTMTAPDAVSFALREISAVTDDAPIGKGPRHIGEIAPSWNEEFQERAKRDGSLVGLSTGFQSLDDRWGGMRGGQLIVIAGRPKMGKSTLAANIAQFCAKTVPVCVFNLEMSELELVDRAVSAEGNVHMAAIRSGKADGEGMDRVVSAWHSLLASQLYIDDTANQTLDTIRLQAKAFVKNRGKGLIVIDYLQLIKRTAGRSTNDEVAELSRGLKLLAKETDCPVIVLSQMNRSIEGSGRKPQLSDLRDSGAIEQDADTITFVHKDDVEQNWAEVITRAMRSGQPGTDHFHCRFEVSKFVPVPLDWEVPQEEQPKRKKGLR